MDRWLQMVLLMPEDDYITNKALSDSLGVSNRTIYNDINQLNAIMRDHGAQLETKPHYGVRLVVTDRAKYLAFLRSLRSEAAASGDNAQMRIHRILARLLHAGTPIKMDDLADELYISRSTLKTDLKQVRAMLEDYDLKIDARSYAGMQVVGSEKDLRRCLVRVGQYMIDQDGDFLSNDLEELSALLKEIFRRHHYQMAAYCFHSFVLHVYIGIRRIRSGREIPPLGLRVPEPDPNLRHLCEELTTTLEQHYGITFSQAEFRYLLLHLECKQIPVGQGETVVSAEVHRLVTQMLQQVQTVFHYDFLHDFDLITNLALHVVPLQLRLQCGLPFSNPMTKEIRENAPLAYEMASVACSVLAAQYGRKVCADEIAYIALHFNVAIERQKKRHKKNVLIVCGTGRASAMLISYRVREAYGSDLNVVGTHESADFSGVDFSGIDYVLTTVPIREHLPVPVIELSRPFSGEIHDDIRKHLQSDSRSRLMQYFSPELFFSHLTEDSKEKVLSRLCQAAVSARNVPEDLYDHVIQRESMGGTAFGNYVAIPHPNHPIGDESFVVTGILDRPIPWDREQVQIVFLISMKAGGDRNLQLFYKTVSRFLSDKALVQRLLQSQSYDTLLTILDALNYDA